MLHERSLSFSGISGTLAKTEISFTKVLTLFSMLSEMKPSLNALRLHAAPSAAEWFFKGECKPKRFPVSLQTV